MKDILEKLRAEGKNYEEIGRITGLSKSTISYYIGKKSLRLNKTNCKNCNALIIASKTFCDKKCNTEWLNQDRINKLLKGELRSNDSIRAGLILKDGENCSICGIGKIWNGENLTLQVDHINGDSDNNNYENVRLICPNCHSQLQTSKDKKTKKESKRNQYLRKYKGY